MKTPLLVLLVSILTILTITLVTPSSILAQSGNDCVSQCLSSRPNQGNFCASQCGTLPLVNLNLDSKSQTISPIFFGYNTGGYSVDANDWNNAAFLAAAAKQKPGTLRFPGGTVANFWDWEKGWFVTGYDPFGYGPTPIPNHLEDFQHTITATGATPIFDVNILTSTLDSQLAMLHHAQQLGLPVNYVELGNEFYLPGNGVDKFPSGAAYGSLATIWAAAIHKDFPNAKVAAVAAPEMIPFYWNTKPDPRQSTWNYSMFTTLKGVDAVTLHIYDSGGNSFEKMFGMAFTQMNGLKGDELQTLPPGVNVWITEFNIWGGPGFAGGSWGQGLANTFLSLLFLGSDKITLVNFESILGYSDDGALFLNNDGLNNPWDSVKIPPFPKTTQFGRNANGWVFSLLSSAMQGMTTSQKILFSPNPDLHGGQMDRGITSGSVSGNTVTVNFNDKAVNKDWIGIFAVGADNMHEINWKWLNNQQGTAPATPPSSGAITLSNLPAGTYSVRYIYEGTGVPGHVTPGITVQIGSSSTFTVSDAYPSFVGYKFSNGASNSAIILNLSSTPYSIKTDKLNLPTYEQIFTQPSVYVSNDQLVNSRNAMVLNNTILLPPYSVVMLSSQNPHLGDLNYDERVDSSDVSILTGNFDKTGTPGWIESDINNDGKVDIFDYNILVGNFGK